MFAIMPVDKEIRRVNQTEILFIESVANNSSVWPAFSLSGKANQSLSKAGIDSTTALFVFAVPFRAKTLREPHVVECVS